MSLSPSLTGHGTFLYDLRETIYHHGGSVRKLVRAMQRCKMNHAWIRVHGRHSLFGDPELNREVVEALTQAGIAVAAWGWCQGEDIEQEADLAIRGTAELRLKDYVADIENGHNESDWTRDEITDFLNRVRIGLPQGANLAVSTFCLIDWHEPELMESAEPLVDAFAPQVYWFWYPTRKMQKAFGERYSLGDPMAYADLCLDCWRKITQKPLILTGQAYWGEREGWTQTEAETRLKQFLDDFKGRQGVVGLNWWHFGGRDAMSQAMLDRVSEADFTGLLTAAPATAPSGSA